MRQGLLLPSLLGIGVAVLIVVLVNLYLVQPRLALKLKAPEPLPTIEQMPSPPPGKQVATTMNLIKKMAAAKSREKEVFVPRQVLRNPFLDPALSVAKKEHKGVGGRENSEDSEKDFLPRVQMVMIGEYRKSALLDDVLVAEGDLFRGYSVDRITEAGVSLRSSGKTVMLPLGVYATAALRTPADKRAIKNERENPAPVKQKAALDELLRRLEPLLETDAKRVESGK